MAYIGNTARLCQAIVDGNIQDVDAWLQQEGADPNTRDYTGRTPLHLAVISSTPEIVRRLIDAGARLIARLADGRTALHLAAERGNVEIVKILMDKSIANEAEEEEKRDQRRRAKTAARASVAAPDPEDSSDEEEEDTSGEESDAELVDAEDSDQDGQSMATGSFVKVGKKDKSSSVEQGDADDDQDEPDFYDVNVLAWDTPCSALQLAIMAGNDEVAELLCQEYVADVLLPVKVSSASRWDSSTWVLLAPALALALPLEKAESMVRTLFRLNASSAQADTNGVTVFHRFVEANAEQLIQVLWDVDERGTATSINHVGFPGNTDSYWYDAAGSTQTPLGLAAHNGNRGLTLQMIEKGAQFHIDFETWLKSAKNSIIQRHLKTFEENQKLFQKMTEQPLILALQSPDPRVALDLLERGADVNTLTKSTHSKLQQNWYSYHVGQSALDIVEELLRKLRAYKGESSTSKPKLPAGGDEFLSGYKPGTFQHCMVSHDVKQTKRVFCSTTREYEDETARIASTKGTSEKAAAIRAATETLEEIEKVLLSKDAKRFLELYPDQKNHSSSSGSREEKTPDHYSYEFTLYGVADVTEARRAAYIDL